MIEVFLVHYLLFEIIASRSGMWKYYLYEIFSLIYFFMMQTFLFNQTD